MSQRRSIYTARARAPYSGFRRIPNTGSPGAAAGRGIERMRQIRLDGGEQLLTPDQMGPEFASTKDLGKVGITKSTQQKPRVVPEAYEQLTLS